MTSNPKTFQESESLYSRAAKSELSSDFTTAFRLYLAAADAFLNLSRSQLHPTLQARCKANASKALERAEKIKKASQKPGGGVELEPLPKNCFGSDHQSYVLHKSAIINNIRYPQWSEVVTPPVNLNILFSDPDGQPSIPSSVSPDLCSYTWKRLSHSPFSSASIPADSSESRLMSTDIEQNIVSDCSVCALIAVCVQHDARFGSKLLLSSLVPGQQSGRYDMKALVNGACRRIAIDSALPFDASGSPIGISTGGKQVAWPALIEKGYMKLMGGYDFPGSNSAIDLHVLTGWIPEHVELQSAYFEKERTWRRIISGFCKGCCVLTVGTDSKTMQKIEGVKLLPSHDYAVIDVRETDNERWITLLDSRVPALRQYPSEAQDNEGVREVNTKPSLSSHSRTLDMRWDDICATFEGVYISWDPGLFQGQLSFNGVWKPRDKDDKAQTSTSHLRLLYTYKPPSPLVPSPSKLPFHAQSSSASLRSSVHSDGDVWVLLTRHLSDTRRDGEYISLSVKAEDDDEGVAQTGIEGMDLKGTYTTSSHVLVRTKVQEDQPIPLPSSSIVPSTPPPLKGAFSILASYDGPFEDVFFSVNVFHSADLAVRWDESAGVGDGLGYGPTGGFSMKIEGTLTTKNAGGNHTHPTYMLNPQWHLRIPEDNASRAGPSGRGTSRTRTVVEREKASVVLNAQGPRDMPLNVTAVWSSGERIVELAQKEVVATSGAYTYGHARVAAKLAAGDYTLILSAFEPQVHLGAFTLQVHSSRRFELTPIPQEGAGMYQRVVKGEWDAKSAAGGPSYGRYHLNPVFEVDIPSNAQLGARLQLTTTSPAASLNLSLFPSSPHTATTVTAPTFPSLDRPLASSGPYSDALSGVDIPPRMVSAGKYWFVPSTWAGGVHTGFRLVVYCSDAGCVVNRRS